MKTNYFLKTYYLLTSYYLYRIIREVFKLLPLQKPIWPFTKLSPYLLGPKIIFVIFLLTFVLSLSSVINPSRLKRVLTTCGTLFLFSIYFSQKEAGHSNHLFLIYSLIIPFININHDLHSKKNKYLFEILQALPMLHFFSSGLWKLRKLDTFFAYEELKKTALDHIAYAIAEGRVSFAPIQEIVIHSPNVLVVGLLLTFIFQLSCIIPLINRNYYSVFTFLAILFHLSTGVVLGIWFTQQIPILLLILLFSSQTEKLKLEYYDQKVMS